MNVVEIKNLTVRYDSVKALDDVSFLINQNDFLGIIGPNGAGKSTLFSCMLGLLQNYEGEIKFFGQDIKKSKKYLKEIGYVPQKPIFEKNFPATVREVVRMGLPRNVPEKRVDEVLKQVWIHELANRRIGELSSGQQQRVFIAKALVSEPKILILDEPVTGIDASSTEIFYSILRDLNKNQNITIIWSSHDLDAVNKLANKVACLNKHYSFMEYLKNFSQTRNYSNNILRHQCNNICIITQKHDSRNSFLRFYAKSNNFWNSNCFTVFCCWFIFGSKKIFTFW